MARTDRRGDDVLEFDRVSKSYGATKALQELSFDVAPGTMFGFVGANGAGKTTAMRIALGVLAADAGQVRWEGRQVDLAVRRRMGYMPEERGLYPKMTVHDQLVYFARLHGTPAGEAGRLAADLTDRLGLGARRDDAVEKLSLGNQQRAQLAVALVHDPEVLVLDEPFSGLDPVGVDALADVLSERVRAGAPVVFSSHQLELVERLCDAVGIINGGRMVAMGTVDELRAGDGRRRLRVVVRGAARGWSDQIAGAATVAGDHEAGETVLDLTADRADDTEQDVLAAAMRAGTVEHFARVEPTLSELFREVVAA